MSESKDSNDTKLEWKDYLAIVVAMFETVLVPVIVVMAVLVVVALLFML